MKQLYSILSSLLIAITVALTLYFGIESEPAKQIILGTVQGVTEWLPVSSEGLIVLIKTNLFGERDTLTVLVREALFLHLGTFLAALIYLRNDVYGILKSFVHWRETDRERKAISKFLIISTLVSGLLGFLLLLVLSEFENQIDFTGDVINILIALMLLATGIIQLKARGGIKGVDKIATADGFLLGIAQGLSVLPGLSRSGITVSSLLLRKFNESLALRLSFLMSIPAVLGANIVLNLEDVALEEISPLATAFAFAFGFLTMHYLIGLSRRVNFAFFVIGFGLLTLLSVFVL